MKGLLGLAVSLVVAPVGLAGSFVVAPDPGVGVDFTSVQAAVDAAVDGDLILLEGAFQESVVIDGKGVTLQGMTGGALFGTLPGTGNAPLLEVRNLAVGQEVHVRGMAIVRVSGDPGVAIQLQANQGRVWMEELFVDTYDGHAVVVDGCSDVMLSEVFLQPNAAFLVAGVQTPASGLVVEGGSVVHGFDLDVTASHGPALFSTPTGPVAGGDAVVVRDSVLHLEATDIGGGSGGTHFAGGCVSSASGGSGLVVQSLGGPAPLVTLRGGTLSAGSSGFFDPACASAPPSAVAIDDPGGVLVQLAGTPRILTMPALPYPNGNFEFQLQGEPGDLFLLFASPGTSSGLALPGLEGELFLDPVGSFLAGSGSLDALGFSTNGAGFDNQGPPLAVRTQAVLLDTQGGVWLTGPGTILFP